MDTAAIKQFITLTEQKRALEQQLRETTNALAPLQHALREAFSEEGYQHVRLDGYTLYLHHQWWVRPREGDYESACRLLRRARLGKFVGPRFDTNQMSAWVRERLNSGERLPQYVERALEVREEISVRARKGD